jgi:hypothetical protein
METKKYTQRGTFSIIVLTPFLIMSLVLILITGFKDLMIFSLLLFIALTFLICLLIFYKLTIYIDNNSISFKLGIGLISRKYLLSEILSCRPVKNNPVYGIGIRLIPQGWLYNVSGLDAVELTFKNKKSKVRIGTDKPDEISQHINKLITSDYSGTTIPLHSKKGYLLVGLITCVITAFPIFLITYGNREPEIIATTSGIKIEGMYGQIVNYSDIKQLDTILVLPRIRARTNGYEFGKILKGNFRFQNQEKARLFVNAGNPPYIRIRENSLNIYINFKEPEKTRELFQMLKNNWKTK